MSGRQSDLQKLLCRSLKILRVIKIKVEIDEIWTEILKYLGTGVVGGKIVMCLNWIVSIMQTNFTFHIIKIRLEMADIE